MQRIQQPPARYNTEEDVLERVPVHAVWELTLACNLKCQHCGSRAGRPRLAELTTEECRDVVRRLAALGTRAVTLIGGESYLRRDWVEIIREIRRHSMQCAVQTGARNLSKKLLADAIEAGLQGLGVSIDGPPDLHDRIRGIAGSHGMAIDALLRAKAAGLRTSVNTTVGSLTIEHLPEIMDQIAPAGASHWQVQLMVAMGNAVDHDELLLQPYQILELMPLLAHLYHEGLDRDVLMIVGNNVGYFGPYEHLWRSHLGDSVHWRGCTAGSTVIGIESDGTIKGCPSLSTTRYGSGNVRQLPLDDIWRLSPRLRASSTRSVDDLSGYCRTCYYAETCKGGCTWMTDSLFGQPGNNPYCHYRALELKKQGLRERVVKRSEAPSGAFTTGDFELVVEPIPDSDPITDAAPAPSLRAPVFEESSDRSPRQLKICRGCQCFVWQEEIVCPHCGADLHAAAAQWAEDSHRRATLVAEVSALVAEMRRSEVATSSGHPTSSSSPAGSVRV